MMSPGSAICPRNRVTTFSPFSLKKLVRISDLPMPCLPTSMMFWVEGVNSSVSFSSEILIDTDILYIFLVMNKEIL